MSKPKTTQQPYGVIETRSTQNKFWVVDRRGDAELGNWLIARTWYRPYADMVAEALTYKFNQPGTTDYVVCSPDYFAGLREGAKQERERCARIARRRSNHSGLHPIEDIAWQIAEEIERAG